MGSTRVADVDAFPAQKKTLAKEAFFAASPGFLQWI
jgi:hypothetical protein